MLRIEVEDRKRQAGTRGRLAGERRKENGPLGADPLGESVRNYFRDVLRLAAARPRGRALLLRPVAAHRVGEPLPPEIVVAVAVVTTASGHLGFDSAAPRDLAEAGSAQAAILGDNVGEHLVVISRFGHLTKRITPFLIYVQVAVWKSYSPRPCSPWPWPANSVGQMPLRGSGAFWSACRSSLIHSRILW